ncbi:MAG: ubiquinone/menaquinone biosynthesis C-methylase UbiE, partial [Gammaproteobacteria bacterium]
MSQSEVNNRYNNTNIDTMQMVYGRGYLSAGGDDEVGRIFQGIDLSDKHILDLGCGLGGASLAMVESLNAEHVTGFDIDENLLTEAQQLIDENSVQSRVSFCHGTPGPLSFSDSEFDLVYMTAVSCHIEDLPPFFEEISRVLKSGGCVVGSEWYRRADNKAYADWDNLLRERGLNFYFKYPDEYTASLQEA